MVKHVKKNFLNKTFDVHTLRMQNFFNDYNPILSDDEEGLFLYFFSLNKMTLLVISKKKEFQNEFDLKTEIEISIRRYTF